MRIPAAAAVAPCHLPAGAKRVTSPGKKILICRSPGSGEPGPGTTAYVTPTHSHRRSCPASPGTPGPGAAAGAVAGFQRARRSLSASSPDVPALGAQRRQRHAGRASLAREREGPQRRHLALNLAGASGRDDRPDRLRGPYYLQRRGHPALPGRAALTCAGVMTFGPCGPGLSAARSRLAWNPPSGCPSGRRPATAATGKASDTSCGNTTVTGSTAARFMSRVATPGT